MTVLALDLGTKCGYAVRRRNGEIVHGTERFVIHRSSHPGRKWTEYREWLSELIQAEYVVMIAYEDVKRHAGTLAAHAYGGFLAMTQMVAQQHNVTMMAVGVGTIKQGWTGQGRADKDAMIAEARRRGFQPDTDNAADALAILHYAMMKEAA